MTNINCSADCIYQENGECIFEEISCKVVTPKSNCAYFVSNNTSISK